MTTSTMATSSKTSLDPAAALQLVEIKPGGPKFGMGVLRQMLPDVETALFFGKVYDLGYQDMSRLLRTLFNTDLVRALTRGDHSTELQDYLLDLAYQAPQVDKGDIVVKPNVPHGEILPELWASLEVTVAKSIKDVATKLGNTVALLPGKNGHMVFKHMMALNRQRPQLGDYKARIAHARQQQNLLILDVSGSMTSPTVQAIVDDVVALSYQANAHMAIVSDHTTHWEPGGYDTQAVLNAATYGGTHYETLAPLFQSHDWGTVITVADYDSSHAAKDHLARAAKSRIGCVVDVSLVNRPTYLAECVGQLADEIKPILVGNSSRVMGSSDW